MIFYLRTGPLYGWQFYLYIFKVDENIIDPLSSYYWKRKKGKKQRNYSKKIKIDIITRSIGAITKNYIITLRVNQNKKKLGAPIIFLTTVMYIFVLGFPTRNLKPAFFTSYKYLVWHIYGAKKYRSSMMHNNIYFLLRFGLANAINDYWRLQIRIVCGEREILTYNAY